MLSDAVRMMVKVSSVPPERRRQALSFLFAEVPEEERDRRIDDALQAADDGEFSLDGLFLAEQNGEPAGAGLTVVQSDGTAFVWPPAVSVSEGSDLVADAIIEAICREMNRQDAWIGQCLLESDADRDRQVLSRNGFPYLLDLLFLQRLLSDSLPPRKRISLQAASYNSESDDHRLASLLERTYVGTLDCPELNDARTGEDALESHRSSGNFNPLLWKRYADGNDDVGVLLMSEHPDQGAWEIVYMGIVPEARGRGYGRIMILDGLHDARSAGAESVFVSVDSRNSHALRIYYDLGFFETTRRVVHARLNLSHS